MLQVPNTFSNDKKYRLTLILLCFGYFMDFYDLTIFSVSYNELIPDLFSVTNNVAIQQLRLMLTNWYTIGIFIGALTFGVLGDKFGRITVIRFSILLYSIATTLSVFTHSITIFAILRFFAGAGLACEFATSNVLIAELFSERNASRGASLLYASGVLGGITATSLGFISWQLMFILGGVGGLILYFARKKIDESLVYLANIKNSLPINRGDLLTLVNTWPNRIKLFKLLMLIVPYSLMISIMFIYPRYMNLSYDISYATKILLLGFFIGNIVSALFSSYIINKFNNYTKYMWGSLFLFIILMPLFYLVTDNTLFLYSCGLGLLGGGYPTVWIQLVSRSYGTNLRNSASNVLFALCRASGIIFNLLVAYWLARPDSIVFNLFVMMGIILMITLLCLYRIKDNYGKSIVFIEH